MSRSITPQNPTTSNTVTVTSTAGFSAGDLIYQKSGAIGPIPDNAITTGSFPLTATTPITQGGGFGTQKNAITAVGGSSHSRASYAAKLTNGNIVIAYRQAYTQYATFRIINDSGVEQVAPVQVAAATPSGVFNNIGVIALTGGGFVVFMTASAVTAYAVYTNTGTVTKAYALDSNDCNHVVGAALPGGGFILAANNQTTSQYQFKIYSATGTQVVAWTNIGATSNTYTTPQIAVRSDNSFCFVYRDSTNGLTIQRYNAAGASQSTNVIAGSGSVGSGANNTYDCTTLSNDTIVIAFSDNSNYTAYATLSAANALSSVTQLAGINWGYNVVVKALSSGGYIIVASNRGSPFQVRYAVYNSSNVLQTADSNNYPGFTFYQGASNGNYAVYCSIVETTSYLTLFFSSANASSGIVSTTMAYMQLNVASPFSVRNQNTYSYSPTAPTTSVSGYVRSTATPNACSFYSATTGTLTTTNAASSGSTFVVSPTFVSGATAAASTTATTVMANGDIVVAYGLQASPYSVKLAVYNSAGVYQNTYTVSTNATGGYAANVRIVALSGGKLGIVHQGINNNTIVWYVFSSAYAQLATGSFSATDSNGTSGGTGGFSVGSLSNNRWIIGYSAISSSYPIVAILSETAVITTYTPQTTTAHFVSVAGNADGSIFMAYYDSVAGSTKINILLEYTTNNWTISSGSPTSYSTGNTKCSGGPNAAFSASGVGAFFTNSGGSNVYFNTLDQGLVGSQTSSIANVTDGTSTPTYVVATSSRGTFVGFATYYSTGVTTFYEVTPGTSNTTTIATTTATIGTVYGGGSYGGGMSLAAAADGLMVFSFLDAATALPKFGIFSLYATSYSTSVTSGVTVSAVALNPSQSNGYIFKGVALTSATAGGTGVVQNVGQAQLSSSYPSGTTYQSFDSTGTLVQGTKGTITGRNVTMTGNS